MLRNPVYVQADLDVYEFFKSQGTVIVNDAADFTGMNGCYLYQGRDVKPSKKNDLKDQMLVLAPHEGIVPSDIWLTCRKKLMNNMKIQSARKATHTWLAGKIKCGNCGYALMSIFNPPASNTFAVRNGWITRVVRVRENHYFGTGSGCLSADDKETGKLQDADRQKESGKGKP